MVYKPKKTVNGHKRNDRSTRRRKARDARKRRAAARPVRSNIKRYVAEQFGKTHPDNRYYLALPPLKPTNTLVDTPRYYPFGASFQKEFLTMEFKRMKEVVSQYPAQRGIHGGLTATEAADPPHSANRIGNYNHWRSLLGRGIHMKNSTVYGTIRLNELVYLQQMDVLKYGNLKLHMFVLEDKAVTKTEFLNWYKDFLSTSTASETARNIQATDGPITNGSYDEDILKCPYVAQSRYVNANVGVAGGPPHTANIRPDGGFDEFLLDWEKFYKTTDGQTPNPNPTDSLFYNEVKCTTDWDGTRERSLLPVNKSRFIVHEHKTWSFKPKANGCLDTVIPFEYSIPEHYMSYDKELLDMPFVWNSGTSTDDQGLDVSWLYPRKQPYIVFVYTIDNPHLINAPTHVTYTANAKVEAHVAKEVNAGATDGEHSNHHMDVEGTPLGANPDESEEQKTGDIRTRRLEVTGDKESLGGGNAPAMVGADTYVPKGDIFTIDMHFKCSYENKLATSLVPTINKGRPIIHKRESAPARKPSTKRDAPTDPKSRKRYTQPSLKDHFKVRRDAGVPRTKSGKINWDAVKDSLDAQESKYLARKNAGRILPPSISKHSAHVRDSKNLAKAKESLAGIYVRNGVMYIYGTRDGEATKAWPHIASMDFTKTPRYKAAARAVLNNKDIRLVVGHSYGAAVAHQLIRTFSHLKGRGYAYPHARFMSHPRFQTFRHYGDIISSFDFQAKTSKRPFRGPLDAHTYKFHDGKYASYKTDL